MGFLLFAGHQKVTTTDGKRAIRAVGDTLAKIMCLWFSCAKDPDPEIKISPFGALSKKDQLRETQRSDPVGWSWASEPRPKRVMICCRICLLTPPCTCGSHAQEGFGCRSSQFLHVRLLQPEAKRHCVARLELLESTLLFRVKSLRLDVV